LDRNHETGIVLEGLLRFMDQQRRNNFSFFEGCSAKRQGGAMSSIPFENLGTLELAARLATRKRNLVGQVADRELMLVNLAPGRLRRDKHGRRPHVSVGLYRMKSSWWAGNRVASSTIMV